MSFNLKYVLGELSIVIFGILIAFALNNWAQSQSDRKLERTYLQNLRSDIQLDLNDLQTSRAQLETQLEMAIQRCKDMIAFLEQ